MYQAGTQHVKYERENLHCLRAKHVHYRSVQLLTLIRNCATEDQKTV